MHEDPVEETIIVHSIFKYQWKQFSMEAHVIIEPNRQHLTYFK